MEEATPERAPRGRPSTIAPTARFSGVRYTGAASAGAREVARTAKETTLAALACMAMSRGFVRVDKRKECADTEKVVNRSREKEEAKERRGVRPKCPAQGDEQAGDPTAGTWALYLILRSWLISASSTRN